MLICLRLSTMIQDQGKNSCIISIETYAYDDYVYYDFPGGSDSKASAYNVGDLGSSHGLALENEMAIHSSTLVWYCPWGRKESDRTE